MKKSDFSVSKGFWLAVLSAFLGALSLVNTRYLLLQHEHPLNVTAWVSMGAAIPWLFLLYKHKSNYIVLPSKYKWALVGIGVISSIGINYLQTLALAHTSSINHAFLYRTIVIFTIIFAALFLKEKITTQKWIMAGLVLLGAYLLTFDGQGITLGTGDLYTLAMAASAALIANVFIKHTLSKMHPDLNGAVIHLALTISLVVLAGISGVFQVPQALGWVISGSMMTFAHIAIRNRAYQLASASFVSLVYSLTPLFVVLISYVTLGEKLSPLELLGGLIIVGAALATDKLKV